MKQCGLILGVFEGFMRFRVYLMDDKLVVNTQNVKYIEMLSLLSHIGIALMPWSAPLRLMYLEYS
jgi:hypothetical protein